MKASIVTPSYNCLPLLKITISSLEKQDVPNTDFEVVVVDDGSTDGTADYLKSYRGPLKLIPVINCENLGRAKSRNAGIKAASNELIIFLDADIEVQKDFVRLHVESHSKGPCVSIGKVLYPPDLKVNRLMKYLLQKGHSKMKSGMHVPGKYFITTNSSVPKNALMEIGCFDTNFRYYGGEDTELGIRLAKKLPMYALPEALGYNRHLRQLDEWLGVLEEYGEYSLMQLFADHPEYIKVFKLRHTEHPSLAGFMVSIFCSAPVYFVMKSLAKIGAAPMFVYSYLLYRTYRKGYLKRKK